MKKLTMVVSLILMVLSFSAFAITDKVTEGFTSYNDQHKARRFLPPRLMHLL